MDNLIAIIGARPQFIKHFAFDHFAKDVINLKTIHTGQHYDENMSKVFFEELKMRKPDFTLSTGGGNHGEQTGKMLVEIESILEQEKPDGVVVYGDTNSTLAGALAAAKLHIPVIHIEAGIRSYNKKLPEEVNRLLTDHITSLFFIPTEKARFDLEKEGITENIYNVGDIMKDVLDYVLINYPLPEVQSNEPYYYATVHRPYNTDDKDKLKTLLDTFQILDKKVIFAIHPRTNLQMKNYGLDKDLYTNINFIDPQSYVNNLSYMKNCEGVITDSGGLQKEAYWMKKKVVTLRTETEWVETLKNGWNQLCFENINIELPKALLNAVGPYEELYSIPDTSKKIIEIIKSTNLN